MGEDVVVDFEKRDLDVLRGDDGQKNEIVSVGYYNVLLDDGHSGSIMMEQIEVARPSILTSTPTNIFCPVGTVSTTSPLEVCGSSSERKTESSHLYP